MSQIYKPGSGGSIIPIPVPVIDGGTGNTGHGETSINSMQINSVLVDGLVAGVTTIFTPPSNFIVYQFIFQVVTVTGAVDTATFTASIGYVGPGYDDILAGLSDIPKSIVNEMSYQNEPPWQNDSGFVPAGSAISINITVPATVATVYTFRVFLLGFYV